MWVLDPGVPKCGLSIFRCVREGNGLSNIFVATIPWNESRVSVLRFAMVSVTVGAVSSSASESDSRLASPFNSYNEESGESRCNSMLEVGILESEIMFRLLQTKLFTIFLCNVNGKRSLSATVDANAKDCS